MLTLLSKIFASFGASAFIKLFRGVAGPVLDHYKEKEVQETARQSTWAQALVKAAEADVVNRKTAAEERAGNPWLMTLYINIVFWPMMYWTLFWLDTIFSGLPFFNTWDLPRAPERLEEFGQYVIVTFLGGGSAVFGITKGAKILRSAKMFGK